MARQHMLVFVALLELVGACATAPPTPESQEVDSLKVEGTKQLSSSDVTEHLVTGESSWLPWWVPVLGRIEWYDPNAWQVDLQRIARLYEAHGYYQAKVVEDVVTPSKPGHVRIVVKVREGEPARITALDVAGLDLLTAEQRATLNDALPLKSGDIFVEEKWELAKTQLASALRELGYAEAAVVGEAVVDADAATVAITLTATTGPRYRFGDIFVATDPGAQVPARAVADQATPDVKPGDWYSESALAEAQARVFQMGVFGAVKVNRGAPDRDDGTVPIVIDVREAPFRSVRFGVGLGGDLNRQEAHLIGEFTHRNLGLTHLLSKTALLDRLTLKAKVGWAALPTIIDVARSAPGSQTGPIGQLVAQYEVPRLFGTRTLSLQDTLTGARALEPAFDYFSVEEKLGLVWRPRIDVSVFPSLNVDAYFLNSDIRPGTNAPAAAIGCPKLPAACVITYLDLSLEWDKRDDRLEPTRGFYLGLSVQGGLSAATQLTPYARVSPEARGYLSFGKTRKVVLAGRVKVGTLLAPRNDTPIIARFFSGGSGMRGFNQRRLSPLVAVPGSKTVPVLNDDGTPKVDSKGKPVTQVVPDLDNGQGLPIGGSGLAEASLELRWHVLDDWVLALFSDAGLVTWEPLFSTANPLSAVYVAVGFGVRYRTPLGPVRLDLAYRLPLGQPLTLFNNADQPVRVPAGNGCFGLFGNSNAVYGGSPEGVCAWHLSIGEAF